MNSESEILKTIWENKGETYIKLISNQTRFGLDYVRYICNCLSKKGQIKSIKKKQGWYRITAKGKRELKLREVSRPKVLMKEKGIKMVVFPWPKFLSKVKPSKDKFITIEEKRLKIGKRIEKIASFLRGV